jgi:CheY-like chemotaxis protein
VLLVDDEPRILEVASQILPEFGYRITCFSDASAALRAFAAEPHAFDIAVTDHSMPGMDGIEFAQRISAARPGVPILLLSGSPEMIAPESYRGRAITATLTKPIAMSELARRIRAVLDTKQQGT